MLRLRQFIQEYEQLFFEEFLNEADGQSSDTKGKLHEILVGHHLLGGNHMQKHPDEHGDTPEQAHDKLKAKVTPEEYHKINHRAKAAAEDIRSKIEKNGRKIHDVHWTSKPGDIEKTTGIKSSQKEDQSDLVVSSHDHNGRKKHHGVSLKVTDTTNHRVPLSNAGKEALHPEHEADLAKHREMLHKKHPELKTKTNHDQRKEFQNSDPEREKSMRSDNLHFLKKQTEKTHKHLNSLSQEKLIHHIKKHVLQSNKTPMQEQGHDHIRHTTYRATKKEGGGHKFDSHTPSEHYSKYFDGSHHITAEHKPGTTEIHFHAEHKDTGVKTRIATQRHKLVTGSDPLSSIKASGKAA